MTVEEVVRQGKTAMRRSARLMLGMLMMAALALASCASEPTPESQGRADDAARRVLHVTILDNDEYQGPSPRNLAAKSGEVVELRFTNEDRTARNSEISANSHAMIITGPGASKGFLTLRPGQTDSIVFTAEAGTYTFYCANTACDIHTKMTGTVEITPWSAVCLALA